MKKEHIYKYLFFAIVLLYAVFLSFFGFENWDTGYITSFSWRIVNGNAPYADFIYKGPPVTLYLHALWLEILPETGQFYFVRLANYLAFALQVFLTVSAFDRLYDFSKIGFDKWGIMCLGFVISLLNFPAFPWPTTDGLFFASIALYLTASPNKSTFRIFIIALCCILSALTKQSFYVVPLLFLGWIAIKDGISKGALFLMFLIGLIAGYIFFITQITSLDRYIDLTTGETNLQGLIYVGIHEYKSFFVNAFIIIPILIAAALLAWQKRIINETKLQSFLQWIPIVIFIISIGMCFANEYRIASRIAFVACALQVGYSFFFRKLSLAALMPVVVALGIAWSASISFGYSYPIFYATGIIAGFIALGHAELKQLVNTKYIGYVAIALALIAIGNNYRPYREQTFPQLTHSLGVVSPKLKYTFTNQNTFEKHLELKGLVAKYGSNFIVAPSIPMANYLFDQQSNLPADWIINTEVNREYDLFVNLAADEKNYIFLEKSYLEGEEMSLPDKKETSEIAWAIYNDFKLVEETPHFIIYNGLK